MNWNLKKIKNILTSTSFETKLLTDCLPYMGRARQGAAAHNSPNC